MMNAEQMMEIKLEVLRPRHSKITKGSNETIFGGKKLVKIGKHPKEMSQFKTFGPAPIYPMVRKEINKK